MTILNKTEIFETVSPEWFLPTIIIVPIVIIVFGALLAIAVGDGDILFFTCVVAIAAVFAICAGSEHNSKKEPTGRYEYEVTLSDDASFTDIIKEYDFVEQRGDIYVLRDKGDISEEEGEKRMIRRGADVVAQGNSRNAE